MAKINYDNLDTCYLRALCIDMINKANSGHPGMALGSAPVLEVLFKEYLTSDVRHPDWINRDRFVLSAGHASALLYAMIHLVGYPLSLDDLKQFRQIGSLTPGHPEYRHTVGVDATSGPLGQGISQAVGLAIAERHLHAILPEKYQSLVDHYTFALCGDGCLEEGISQEAISLAGHLGLNKLILIYDCNDVTLDGPLAASSSDMTALRFKAANWNVILVDKGQVDPSKDAISKAIKKAKKETERPTLIIVHTTIGYGSSKQGTSKVHGSPLGESDGLIAKQSYGYPDFDKTFCLPEDVYSHFRDPFAKRGKKAYAKYNSLLKEAKREIPELVDMLLRGHYGAYSYEKIQDLAYLPEASGSESTRAASGKILNLLHPLLPNLLGGSADVAGSVMTKIKGASDFSKENYAGTNINYGIREFAMASINNGILLHGGLRAYGGCFLVFSDYLKPAIRLASLSKLPAIYLFSHDSVALGEDGPTHQPIEQLAMLRSIPGVNVYRPADGYETLVAYKMALKDDSHPSCLILSRQNLPYLTEAHTDEAMRGAYILKHETAPLKGTIIACGSEVALALEAIKDRDDIRLVSMLCSEVFDRQDENYKEETLGARYCQRIAVEMLSSFGWHKYAKHVMSVDNFGYSGKSSDIIAKIDFTPNRLRKLIEETLD